MAKKGGNKSAAQKKGKKNWIKIILPLFLVFVMVSSALYLCVNTRDNYVSNSTSTSTDIKFKSIVDGLKIAPPGADYGRFVDLTANSELASWTLANLNASTPDQKTFGARPQKDLLVNYPQDYFTSYPEQWVSITDFGPDYTIKNPNETTYQGVKMGAFNTVYTYSETRPTVSGRIQNVADMILFWSNPGNRTAYDDYSDLMQQLKGYPANATSARLAVVGTKSYLNYSDRYYAGITPDGNGNYTYQAVLHLNKTLNDTEKQEFKSRYEQIGLVVAGFSYYSIDFVDDYLILNAKGDLATCTFDMANNWRFLKA